MYDPTAGRFLSEDPIGFEGDPTNLYRYVENFATGATDPDGFEAINAADFWKGAVIIAKAQALPDWMLRAAAHKNFQPPIKAGDGYGYDRRTGAITISDPDQTGKKCVRVGKAGKITNERTDVISANLTLLYQETFHFVFHRWVEDQKSGAGWLRNIIKKQNYADHRTEKAEEAMSSIITRAVEAMRTGRRVPTYQEVLSGKAGRAWSEAITPHHPTSDRKYLRTADARKPVTEELYYAALNFLHNTYKRINAVGLDRLKNDFEQYYRTNQKSKPKEDC